MFNAMTHNFLGKSPLWYKVVILVFLVINPIVFYFNPFVAGWLLIAEFIFTLAMALVCYPLPAGGLLALEAIVTGMTKPEAVYNEVAANLPVILLLMFMVAGIHFMKEALHFTFTRILVNVKSKTLMSLLFCFAGAFLSAFLDALTVVAVIIAACYGFYTVYHNYVSKNGSLNDDSQINEENKKDLEDFRGFLRNILMHGAVGTALGGAMTLVGEPQNLLIGAKMGWHFMDFIHECLPVSGPVLISGLIVCLMLEKTKIFGYGREIPQRVRSVLENAVKEQSAKMDAAMKARLVVQLMVGIILIVSLAFHVAEVGLIGLMVIILLTSFNGVTKEHSFGEAFTDGLPFTGLLIVFFSIVAVIHELHLFTPIVDAVLALEGGKQLTAFFIANGVLSAISDNVFVATVYISEVVSANEAGAFVADPEQFNRLAVAVNMGTNIPSVATPNGQAAFLFLLTSAVAPLIRLSYMQMVKLALPYAIIMTAVGLAATAFLL